MLVGLDLFCKHKLVFVITTSKINQSQQNWPLPITFKAGHVFFEWTHKDVWFKKWELKRLHLHVFHPAVDKLFALIRRFQPDKATGTSIARLRKSHATANHAGLLQRILLVFNRLLDLKRSSSTTIQHGSDLVRIKPDFARDCHPHSFPEHYGASQ